MGYYVLTEFDDNGKVIFAQAIDVTAITVSVDVFHAGHRFQLEGSFRPHVDVKLQQPMTGDEIMVRYSDPKLLSGPD
jgi:hypothetical protein